MSAALATGNPVDGFTFIGAFDDREGAIEYAENHDLAGDWWVIDLQPPDMWAWVVVDNVTGSRYSQPYDSEEGARHVCRTMNINAGPGGRFGVRQVTR